MDRADGLDPGGDELPVDLGDLAGAGLRGLHDGNGTVREAAPQVVGVEVDALSVADAVDLDMDGHDTDTEPGRQVGRHLRDGVGDEADHAATLPGSARSAL